MRSDDADALLAVVQGLLDDPPTDVGRLAVLRVDDLAAGADGLPPTDGVRFTLAGPAEGGSARLVVRPSGTEPKVKAYLEVVVPLSARVAGSTAARHPAAARAAAAEAMIPPPRRRHPPAFRLTAPTATGPGRAPRGLRGRCAGGCRARGRGGRRPAPGPAAARPRRRSPPSPASVRSARLATSVEACTRTDVRGGEQVVGEQPLRHRADAASARRRHQRDADLQRGRPVGRAVVHRVPADVADDLAVGLHQEPPDVHGMRWVRHRPPVVPLRRRVGSPLAVRCGAQDDDRDTGELGHVGIVSGPVPGRADYHRAVTTTQVSGRLDEVTASEASLRRFLHGLPGVDAVGRRAARRGAGHPIDQDDLARPGRST